jgi:DNA invertase Pin-like site-specific DNA recombinase
VSRISYSRSRRRLDASAGRSDHVSIGGQDWTRCSKGVAQREFDIVAAWSVCRLGRSLSDLIDLHGELQARDIDLYLYQQAIGISTPSGRMLFGMLGVFSEFERSMIRDRVMAGLDRARSSGKRLGRPRTTPFKIECIRRALDEGRGIRETARLLKVSAVKVSEVRRMSAKGVVATI